jgi:uncharacterized protein (TIGR02757 family)
MLTIGVLKIKVAKYPSQDLKHLLDEIVYRVNDISFIENDPISIPHRYTKPQDIEIAGLFAAVLAWGKRKTIINKTNDLLCRMDNDPHAFIVNHSESDRVVFVDFVHRTFQGIDAIYFVDFLQRHYQSNDSLETVFYRDQRVAYNQTEALDNFYKYFSDCEYLPHRTLKHVAAPSKNSTCKRLNMYLRWMVRNDDKKVDFGLWRTIPMSGLMIPLDVHVENYSRQFGLLTRKQRDWKAVEELTAALRQFDPHDPVRYDYALFGLGVINEI